MNGPNRFLRDFSLVASRHVITLIIMFGFTVAQARYLGPAQFGELSLALSYAAILAMFVDFGMTTQLARVTAQRPERAERALSSSLLVGAALWSLALPIVWVATAALDYTPTLRGAIIILTGSLFFGNAAGLVGAYFQGREDFFYPSVAIVVQKLGTAVLGGIALIAGGDVIEVAVAFLVGDVLSLLVRLFGFARRGARWAAPDRDTVQKMFLGALPLGVFWLLGAVYFNIDIAILERLAPKENVGWYAAAYRLFGNAAMLPTLVSGVVLYPALSRLSAHSRDTLPHAFRRAFRLLAIVAVLVAVLFLMLADDVVALLYDRAKYAEAATALRLLAPALLTLYVGSIFQYANLALHRERALLVMAGFLAVANPLANVVTIPLLQENGAALTKTLTEFAAFVCLVAIAPADLRSAIDLRLLPKLAGAALVTAIVATLLHGQHVLLALAAATAAYVAAALVLGAIPQEDVNVIRDLFATRRATARV